MGHTLLCLRVFFFLNLLYRGQAQEAVLTIEPNWTTFFIGESVTFKCDITGDKDSDWMGSTKESNKIYLNVSDRPKAVLTVSPSWPSPGASVTLDCIVDHPSAGWSFYWYKAVPKPSHNSYDFYDYELLPGSENGTEQHLFIIDGQTHTAGYVCRAGRGDPVYYSGQSEPKFVWSGDLNSAASLTVSPDSVQHFTKTSVSLSCEGNSTQWRVMRFTKSYLYRCSSWGKMTGSTCTITGSWVSGVFWCESETGQFSNAVNITKYVAASRPGKASQFPILLIVGLLGAVVLIILLLLFLYLYRKSKDSCCIRSQRTNQGPATDHMFNQDETNQRENASVLQDNACLYETIKGPEEPANDESRDVTYSVVELKNISKKGKRNEPEDCVYSHVKMTSAAGKSSPAPADESVYSELKPGTALGKIAA
ncbi:hypothetical protein JOQ06_023598 [Pogonophryne albipinna]|uniref:Ig-like domain-containing protein n=1 Tax=Pogonophryne albipinna TaxID=1090488 RepID=A0AAD6FSZ6_9TELE|nr:hypothetical protein JOQ06_023598 [Pogonophryne albipinna]